VSTRLYSIITSRRAIARNARLVNPKRIAGSALGRAGQRRHFVQARACAVETRKSNCGADDLREHLDLVAVGTVADIVPLNWREPHPGAGRFGAATADAEDWVARVMEIADVPDKVSPYHVGFASGHASMRPVVWPTQWPRWNCC